jgi:hypothetical protein
MPASLSRDQLVELLQHRQPMSLSILSPMDTAGADVRQNPIRFKDALYEGRQYLEKLGMDPMEIERRLKEPLGWVDQEPFWAHQGQGLAVYISSEDIRYFRLPLPVESLVHVGERFYTKPLMRLFNQEGVFYILALSQHESRLYEANRYDVRSLELVDAPQSIEELTRFVEEEKDLKFHTMQATPPGDTQMTMGFHGHGVGADEELRDQRIAEYCRMVDRSIKRLLLPSEAPLVVAAAEPVRSIYRQNSQYPGLVRDGIQGNPEMLKPDELHELAWPIVEPIFERPLAEALDRFREALGNDMALTDPERVVLAAHDGRIETLIVHAQKHRWGSFDEQRREVQRVDPPMPGHEDLLDRAAAETYLHGGRVFVLEPDRMPDPSPTLAVLRYPLPTPAERAEQA